MSEKVQIRRILEYALEREHQGMAFFKSNASRLNHPAAREVFERLVDEERKHAEYIQNLLDNLEKPGVVITPTGLPNGNEIFQARAEMEHLDQTVYESMAPDVTILRMAFLIERDFAEFYRDAASNSTGEVKEALEKLARWEEGHERLFKQFHDTLYKQYIEMPWGG
ncbi:MAG: ferritin family protein [Anaerolineales bacterium]|nr:ferritin family protein [Anaerolineales bacterium]